MRANKPCAAIPACGETKTGILPKRLPQKERVLGARLLQRLFHYDRHAHPRMDAALKVMFAF